MSTYQGKRICLVPQVSGVGGMVSFQRKLERGLTQRNIQVSHHLDDVPYQAILIIGGTRQLPQLRHAKTQGIRIVQRLDGMNWLHRVRRTNGVRRTNVRHFIRAEYSNWLLSFIRSRLADRIVYQSHFSQAWWERVHGRAPADCTVVYNGVDLSIYTPLGAGRRPSDRTRILMVEGSLMGGYEMGLELAINMTGELDARMNAANSHWNEQHPVELMVLGRVEEPVKQHWQSQARIPIIWAGLVSQDRIPEFDRSAHLLYSADIHPACPNSVIEALACGLPVLAYDTGALSELVEGLSGCIVPYGGDAWRLEQPDTKALVDGALQILGNQDEYRSNARLHAEQVFDLERMVEEYLHILLDT